MGTIIIRKSDHFCHFIFLLLLLNFAIVDAFLPSTSTAGTSTSKESSSLFAINHHSSGKKSGRLSNSGLIVNFQQQQQPQQQHPKQPKKLIKSTAGLVANLLEQQANFTAQVSETGNILTELTTEGTTTAPTTTTTTEGPFHFGNFGDIRDAVTSANTAPGWRSNRPKETMSDWTVRVQRKASNQKPETYHVHKYVLAVGERRSLYFSKILRETAVEEHQQDSTTKGSATNKPVCTVELLDAAADVFPTFLDHVYNVIEHPAEITTHNAVPLRHLARFLAAESLFNEVNAFMQEDLKADTAPIYAAMATTLGETSILAAAMVVCSDTFEMLDDVKLATVLPGVFQEIALKSNCDSIILSNKVASYCRENEHNIDKNFINELTKPSMMPVIDPLSAIWLLKYALVHNLARDTPSELSLASRCKAVLVGHWRTVFVLPDFAAALDPLTQLELMKEALPIALEKADAADELGQEVSTYHRLPNTFASRGYRIMEGGTGARAFNGFQESKNLYYKDSPID